MSTQVFKYQAENRLYAMSFAQKAEIIAGQTLTGTPTVTAVANTLGSTALTIGSPSISGSNVIFQISGGTGDTNYTITVVVSTNVSPTVLVGEGMINIAP